MEGEAANLEKIIGFWLQPVRSLGVCFIQTVD